MTRTSLARAARPRSLSSSAFILVVLGIVFAPRGAPALTARAADEAAATWRGLADAGALLPEESPDALAAIRAARPLGIQGTRSFGPPVDYVTGAGPYCVVLADVNGDGTPDMVGANGQSSTVSVLLGDGLGGFGAKTDITVGRFPRSVAVADMNGDHAPDLVVANLISGTISVLLGNGSGGFGAKTDHGVGRYPYSVAAADFDGDGAVDIATANYGSSSISLRLGDGAGGFRDSTEIATGAGPIAIAAGDVNADGRIDLVTADAGANTATVLLGDGHGGFATGVAYATGAGPRAVLIRDMNQDGKPDLVTANLLGNSVSFLAGNGAGGFANRVDSWAGTWPRALAAGNLNADTAPDLVVANWYTASIALLAGNGSGSFATMGAFAVGRCPASVTLASLNGDAWSDLAVANSDTTTVSVLFGRAWQARPSQTTLQSSANPSAPGDPLVLTATVTSEGPGYEVPTGIVTFRDATTSIGAAPLIGGRATITTSTLDPGTHVLRASYDGDSTFLSSTSNPWAQTIGGARHTIVSLISSANPQAYGADLQLIATISAEGNGPAITGFVDFFDDATPLGRVAVANAQAMLHTSTLSAGYHMLYAVYRGDDNYAGSMSSPFYQTIQPGTVTTLTSAANPSELPLHLTAHVAPQVPSPGHTPTGTLSFFDGSYLLGSAPLAGDSATCEVPALSAGEHDLRAAYGGDSYFHSSLSAWFGQGVVVWTQAVLGSSVNPSIPGRSVTLLARITVSPPGSGTPTGRVLFHEGATLLGSAGLDGAGVASFATPGLAAGDHAFSATFEGSTYYHGSTSPSFHQIADASARIASIRDVPADQGREVRIVVRPSRLDSAGSVKPILRYDLFRRIETAQSADARPAWVQVAGWDAVGSMGAYADTIYNIVVPTLADSNAAGAHLASFFVRAATDTPAIYYDSAPDSGYSVDNLAPASPAGFTAARAGEVIALRWRGNPEPDLCVYRLYRGASHDFAADSASLIATTTDTSFTDEPAGAAWYLLSAEDVNGNASAFDSLAVGALPATRVALALGGVRPNPARGMPLHVTFALPSGAPARLELLDVSGRRVAAREVGTLGAGSHEIELGSGRLAPGIYVVRLTQAGEARTTRVTALR